MSRKNRKARKKAARSKARRRKAVEPRGFDFGCLPYAMAIGSFDFPGFLSGASVIGVAYGQAWSSEVNQVVPTVSLVAQNGDALAKAFERFNAWAEVTDPDSLELTIVFRANGGYVLALSPEQSRLERRCLGFERTHRPLVSLATWCKPIDSVHPFLRKLREYHSAPVAPFLFGGGVYSGPTATVSTSSPPALREVEGLRPLLKFEATFVDEADVEPNTMAWVALKTTSSSLSSRPKETPKPSPLEIAARRVGTLRVHFPVTLERIRRSPEVRDLVRQLTADGVAAWQIEQALCNLTLSRGIAGTVHYLSLGAGKAQRAILEALRGRYELADNDKAPGFNVEDVRAQVLADANALLRCLDKPRVKDLPAAQAALRSASALDAGAAIADPLATRTGTP